MNKIKLSFLVLIALIWFAIILPYFVGQTAWGSRYISQLLTRYHPDYSISIGTISHSLVNPYEIKLNHVEIKDKQQQITYLSAEQLVLGLEKENPLQWYSFNYAIVDGGSIALSSSKTSSPISQIVTRLLQLNSVDISYINPDNNQTITLHHIKGGIKTTTDEQSKHQYQIKFTAQQASYNDLEIHSLSVRGYQNHQTFHLNQISGNINHGFFSGRAAIHQDGSLNIADLKIDRINLQSQSSYFDLDELFSHISQLTIQQLSIINSSLSSPQLMIEKGNLEANNLVYQNRQWQLEKSNLTFNAQSIVWQDELIEQPLLKWRNNDQQIIIEQAIAKWNKGSFHASGSLQNKHLNINKLFITGLRYQLPENWLIKLNQLTLPDVLSQVTIQQLMLLPSVIIDTNPDFPFEFTLFEGMANNLVLQKNGDKATVTGSLVFKAESSTLNTIGLRRPDLTITLSPQAHHYQFSAMINQGIIEGNATINPSAETVQLQLESYFADNQYLKLWHLVDNPKPTNKFTLQLSGKLTPLKLDGQLISGENSFPIKNQHIITH